MSRFRARPGLLNVAIIMATIVAVALSLVIGRPAAAPATILQPGDIAPETYTATTFIAVDDVEATEAEREVQFNNVQVIREIDPTVKARVDQAIGLFFAAVRAAPAPVGLTVGIAASTVRDTPTTNQFVVDYTITVDNPTSGRRTYALVQTPRFADAVSVVGVTADVDLRTDGVLDSSSAVITPTDGPWVLTGADAPGEGQVVEPRGTDEYVVTVRFTVDPDVLTEENADCIPDEDGSTGLRSEASITVEDIPLDTVTCRELPPVEAVDPVVGGEGEDEETTTTSLTTTTTTIPATTTTLPIESQIALLERDFRVYGDAIPVFVDLYAAHRAEVADGGDGFFDQIEQEVLDQAEIRLTQGIQVGELQDVRNQLLNDPPPIFIPGLNEEQRSALAPAAAEVVAQSLEANDIVDEEATQLARQRAAAAVEPVTRTYLPGEVIVRQGTEIDAVQLEAIQRLGLLDPEPGTSRVAAAALGGLAVLLAALFLWRIAPNRWSQPKHIAILGILLIVAAVLSRTPQLLGAENPQLAYVIPAAMLGYAAAILYDPRTALLTAVPMALFAAISTLDPAITVFAAAATVAPVAFVSAVSTRRELRLAVLLGAVVLVPLAYTIAWMFDGRSEALAAAAAGFVGGLIGGFIGQGLVSFLENLFQITTTVTLLDLTDRNHPALRLIEERAPGTFNHSILVGNLAGKAARAIGADPLFAQAAAFYHDLGKTENPQYFIENQFGVSNPHDELEPVQSAELIRRHVTDGLVLARRYRIPPDIAAAVEQHHGTGLMRFFYHKALEQDPSVDPAAFRHHGVKPQQREMAIVMISDAVEGAARALAQQEDPTSESLKKVVDSIVAEKLEDGQFDESALTFGDLTKVKEALVAALVGYYHTRIPYPGFPGPPAES